MAARFTVLVDDLAHGPFFLPDPDTAMPYIFETWEDANLTAELILGDTADCQVIRLRDA